MKNISPRAAIVYFHDLFMTGAALVVALYLRVGADAVTQYQHQLWLGVPLLAAIAAVVYRWLGLYRGIWRYASIPDLAQLVRAVSVSVLVFVLALFLLTRLDEWPRSMPPILWLVAILMLGGPRFAYRLLKDRRFALQEAGGGAKAIPVLVLGANDAAEVFIRSLGHSGASLYRIVGLVDDKGRRTGHAIRGVPVLGGPDDLEQIVADLERRGLRPQRLIIARPQAEMHGDGMRRLFERADGLGLTLARLPALTEFKSALDEGKIELRPIAIEDLLGRPQAALNRGAIVEMVAGLPVLVTGAGGTIGAELTRQIAALNPSLLVLLDSGEFNLYAIEMEIRERFPHLAVRAEIGDVRDRDRVFRLLDDVRPALVFHAAALKHVPLVEANPAEGALTNAIGTRNVADAARACQCRAMVLISTDKAIRPTSVMGACKRLAESYCQALDLAPAAAGAVVRTRFMTVRFGNVLGSSGSVVPLFQRQLAAGGPLTVTHPDMRRYFMTVREAVELVLQASAHGAAHGEERGKILVLDMGQPVKIVDLARQMIRLAGFRPDQDVKIAFTGLRPGEKLFEELLSADETPTRTEAEGVFLAAPLVLDHGRVSDSLARLESAARAGDAAAVLQIIADGVPDFRAPEVTPTP